MRSLASLTSLAVASARQFSWLGRTAPIILGGYTKRDWTKSKHGDRYLLDARHRKAVDGNRVNVRRMQRQRKKQFKVAG